MNDIEQKILDEMIYDRVRSCVNLCQLVIIEQELDESIERAIRDLEDDRPRPSALAREHLQRAWQRLEREWQTLREDLAHAQGE